MATVKGLSFMSLCPERVEECRSELISSIVDGFFKDSVIDSFNKSIKRLPQFEPDACKMKFDNMIAHTAIHKALGYAANRASVSLREFGKTAESILPIRGHEFDSIFWDECDGHSIETCRQKFDNTINFGGEPELPDAFAGFDLGKGDYGYSMTMHRPTCLPDFSEVDPIKSMFDVSYVSPEEADEYYKESVRKHILLTEEDKLSPALQRLLIADGYTIEIPFTARENRVDIVVNVLDNSILDEHIRKHKSKKIVIDTMADIVKRNIDYYKNESEVQRNIMLYCADSDE